MSTEKPAKQEKNNFNVPIMAMIMLSMVSGVIVAGSFIMIRHWPLPISVDPYFGGRIGLIWGLVVGAVVGLIIGYLVDEKHFS